MNAMVGDEHSYAELVRFQERTFATISTHSSGVVGVEAGGYGEGVSESI